VTKETDVTVVDPEVALEPADRPLHLSHLDALESEAVHIFREAAAEFERPVLLFSGGKDSIVMLHLAMKAFWPAKVPFGLLHVDTGHNFPEVLEYRDRTVEQHGCGSTSRRCRTTSTTAGCASARTAPATRCRPCRCWTRSSHRFDAVFGGGRRDEEKARAKERVFSLRDEFGQWDPRRQRPELWSLYNGKHRPGEHVRVFPLSNWTELDVWQYIEREGIELPPSTSPTSARSSLRDGMWLTAGEWGGPRTARDSWRRALVRYRTVGDMSCTGAVDSTATTLEEVITEIAATTLTERGATRADDKLSEAAMEDRKREGYF
jgi:sulfate adenylyltransferase subunit 2